MTERENRLRAWRFQTPEWIPISSGLPFLDWESFGYDVDELETICMRHTALFPGFQRGTLKRNNESVPRDYPDLVAGRPYTDGWGCLWETGVTGMVGAVRRHALEDWDAMKLLPTPDPDRHDGTRPIDWTALACSAALARQNGCSFGCGLPHGHTFLRAQDMRGYVNLILDMADGEPRLHSLLERLTHFNLKLIERFIALKPDYITIAEDLGMQQSPMLSPAQFEEFIAPCYDRLTGPVKRAGIIVHEHSDGFILPLMESIIKTGGDVINLQDLVNGVGNIARELKGRIAIDLDIDRQSVTVHGSSSDIHGHIRECVEKLGSPQGGLSLFYQPWPPTPAANMDAVFTAMEKYCVYEYAR